MSSSLLVRRILIHETGLKFFLKIGISRVGKTAGSLSFGIQADEFLGNILDLGLGIVLKRLPSLGTEFIDLGRNGILGLVSGYLMKRMHGHENHIIVLVHQFYHFMDTPLVIRHSHQTAENAHPMIDMDHIIAYIERAQIIESQLLTFLYASSDGNSVEAVENLMISVTADFVFIVNETSMYVLSGNELRHHTLILIQHRFQPVRLRLLFGKYAHPVTSLQTVSYIFSKQFEVLVEYRLRGNVELNRIEISTRQGSVNVNSAEST